MLNIAICDDEMSITEEMALQLQPIAKQNYTDVEIEVFWNGESLVKAVKENACFDAVFLDIEMSGENGITAAKEIRKYDKNVLIIYVTSHESHMKESFSVRPFQFLVKPVSVEQFGLCFQEMRDEISSGDFYFSYSYRKVSYKIPIQEILWFESDKRKALIITEKETCVVYRKLNEIEDSLKDCKISFLRIHQSFLVNYRHISKMAYDSVEMDNGQILSISEDRRKVISEQYCLMEDTSLGRRKDC